MKAARSIASARRPKREAPSVRSLAVEFHRRVLNSDEPPLVIAACGASPGRKTARKLHPLSCTSAIEGRELVVHVAGKAGRIQCLSAAILFLCAQAGAAQEALSPPGAAEPSETRTPRLVLRISSELLNGLINKQVDFE